MKSLFFKFCLLACIPLFSTSCSETEKLSGNEFLIEGTLLDVEDEVVIALFRMDGNTGSVIASDTLRNGRFTFKGETESNPERLTVLPRGEGFPSMMLSVWVAPRSKSKINGKGTLHPLWEVKSTVPYQKEENRYTNESKEIIAEMARITTERNELMQKIMAGSSEDEALTYRKIVDSLSIITNSLNVKLIFTDINIMEKTDISPIWLDKMRGVAVTLKTAEVDADYTNELREKTERLYGRMSEEDKTTLLGYEITANIFPPPIVEVGDEMADTDFFDIDGNTKHLSDYSGKYLLLDFWSLGCGPCIMALPEMRELYETYHDKLTIISISLDTDSRWKEAMNRHDMPWINIRDPKGMGGLAANYGVRGIPNYVMISSENVIIDKWMGYGTGYLKRKVSENIN